MGANRKSGPALIAIRQRNARSPRVFRRKGNRNETDRSAVTDEPARSWAPRRDQSVGHRERSVRSIEHGGTGSPVAGDRRGPDERRAQRRWCIRQVHNGKFIMGGARRGLRAWAQEIGRPEPARAWNSRALQGARRLRPPEVGDSGGVSHSRLGSRAGPSTETRRICSRRAPPEHNRRQDSEIRPFRHGSS